MTTTIQLPDDQAAALNAAAAAQGLSLVQWLGRLAMQETAASNPRQAAQAAMARILDIQSRVKPDPEGMTIRQYIDHSRP